MPQDGEIVNGQHDRRRGTERPTKRRAVEHVQPARGDSGAERVPERIADTRDPARPAEREPASARARHARRAHRAGRGHAEPCRRASGRAGTCRSRPSRGLQQPCAALQRDARLGVAEQRERVRLAAPAVVDVLLVEHWLPARRAPRRRTCRPARALPACRSPGRGPGRGPARAARFPPRARARRRTASLSPSSTPPAGRCQYPPRSGARSRTRNSPARGDDDRDLVVPHARASS